MKYISKYLLSFLLLFSFFVKIIKSSTEIEINLNSEEKEKIEKIGEEFKSQNIYIKGSIDQTKKYLLISIISEELKPSISITKNKDFDIYKNEYDYILLSNENKLVLPSSYFDSEDINGFYMKINWEGDFSDLNLKFEYVDDITLEIGEEFSFYAKNDSFDNFSIIINNKNKILKYGSSINNIGFTISGGDEKQLSMNVNGNKAIKMLNNIFGYWMENNSDENIFINIKVTKNVKFYFKTQIFNSEEETIEDKKIYENKFNQIYFVKNNREECFNLYFSQQENKKDLIILSQENFILYIYESDSVINNYVYNSSYNELYSISENLKLNNTVNKICIKLNKKKSTDISLIQIYLNNKLNNYESQIFEPLITGIGYKFILPKKEATSSDNLNINIHSHSQFFEKYSEQSDITGINVIIKSISGKIKIYKDLCNTYPKCNYNINSRFKQEIYSIDGYYQTSIKSSSDTYLSSNKQILYIVICEDEENECSYEIFFSDNQKKLFLRSGEKISKFIDPYININNYKNQDLYYAYIHSLKNKIIINLALFSGDAYLVQINDIKGCKFDEVHFGSDERRIFYCDEDEMDDYDINNKLEVKIEFGVRGGKNGAIYSLYAYEQKIGNDEIYIPAEMSKFDIINNNNKFKILYNSYNYKLNKKDNNQIITLINPINCDLNINTIIENSIYLNNNNYIQYITNIKNEAYTNITLDKFNKNILINKCLFYMSSYIYSNDESFLIITENKPLKFNLNNDFDNIRLVYLYAMINGIKKIYLKVSIIGNSAIKIRTENINENNKNEYIVRDNKIITIMNGNNRDIKGLSLNNLCKLKIYIQLYDLQLIQNNNKHSLIEIKIMTDLNTPIFLKRGEQLTDILINNEYKYFIALVTEGSTGNYYINLNNGNIGNIYGRLVDSDNLKEIEGWNNRFVLPMNNTDKNKLLPYDFENQRLIIGKEHTKYCNKFCYLLIGVNLYNINNNLDLTKNNIYEFNSYLNLKDNNDFYDDKTNFIKLKNDEHISGYVTDEEIDYFSYKLNDYNSKLNINFECDNCEMILLLNDTNFKSPKSKKIISYGENYEIKNLGENKDISNSFVFIKINTINNENGSKHNNNIKYKYSLKINTQNDLSQSVKYLDSSIPEICDFTIENKYDFYIKLDTYNAEKDINIIAVPNNENESNYNNINNIKDEIEIYGNILSDSENITENSWPDEKDHQFPSEGKKASNFLKIHKNDKNKEENNKDDMILLIRVYGKGYNIINLYTNYDNKEKEKELLLPGKYQLITVNNGISDSINKIKIPLSYLDKDKEYIYKIKKLDGNGKILYGNEIYEINDKYNSISFPIDQNIASDLNKIDANNTNDESFSFLIKYEEKNNFNSLEKIKIGSSKYFSTKDDTKSINHFIPLTNIDNDLPININFNILHSSEEDEYKDHIRYSTEIFDINGYLITEDELNEIKNGNINFIDNKKNYKYKGNYYLENKQGFLNIKKSDIDNFTKNNKDKKPYLYLTLKKSKINDKKYDNIKGNINIYPSNYTKISLPENDYHINTIDCSKNNSQIYKLGEISKNDLSYTKNIKIDFSSPIEGLKVKIVRDINQTDEDKAYFGIESKENNNGKDIIIVSKNIDKAYLLIETPDNLLNSTCDSNSNVNYMFKYSYENKEKKDTDNNTDIQYNNIIQYDSMTSFDLKTNITFNRIKESKTNKFLLCDYYIRVYKNPNLISSKDNNTFYSIKSISLINNNDCEDIYSIYKIDSNNSLFQNEKESITIPIEIDTNESIFVDVMAESVYDKQRYGYSKSYPNSYIIDNNDDGGKKEDEKKNNNNSEGGISLIKIILISFCILLLIILLIICFIKACSCCGKNGNKSSLRLLSGINDITIHTSDDEDDNNFTTSSLN